MSRILLLACLTLLLVGPTCTALATGGAAALRATGIAGAYSAQVAVSSRGPAVLVGQVLILRQDGRRALSVDIGQLPDSGAGRLRIDTAWHEGRKLRFHAVRRTEPFCTAPGQCRGYRTGSFALTAAEFDAALSTGLRATLVGPDAVVQIHVPGALFAEARDRARATGILPPT